MSILSNGQSSILKSLFGAVPDSAVDTLEMALACEASRGGAIAEVYDLIAEEAADRRIRAQVFGPLAALCKPSDGPSLRFPTGLPKLLMTALRAARPDLVLQARIADARRNQPDPEIEIDPAVYDQLCSAAACGLRAPDANFAPAVALLDRARPEATEEFASMLDLAPVARRAVQKLPDWIGRASEEKSAAARLAYRDAVTLAEDAGPRLFDILYANLPEPWLILRVLSAVMDHPADRYVAVSELARFGEVVLDDIDRRLDQFRAFDPALGRAAGLAAGDALHVASLEIAEFETNIELSREGLWGKRIGKQKQTLAQLAESRLNQIEKVIDAALPQQMVRFGKGLKGQPKLAADPDPSALRKAEGLLAFYDRCRGSASQSGYGATRAKVGEKLEESLDQYIEALLETLRAEEVAALDRVRAYMEAAAVFVGASRGEQAGQLVRRRAAAA